jgi:hypothetical protein
MKDDLMEMALKANKRSFQRAFETAVRTGTALVFVRDGKLVEFKPPYRYELVPIKKKKSAKSKKKS